MNSNTPRGKAAAREIFRRTLASVDVHAALNRCMALSGDEMRCGGTVARLGRYRRIMAIAIGKAAAPMAATLREILAPEFATEGIIVAPPGAGAGKAQSIETSAGWKVFAGGHPIPNRESFAAGRAILDAVSGAGKETLIIFLLSGGGSALAELPLNNAISQSDFEEMNRALVTCGAPIEAINVVRKHVSALKGGRLAAAAPEAMKFTYAISDVPMGHETALASGPTLPDPTTMEDARRVIREHDLRGKLPRSVVELLDGNSAPETPKPGDAAFAHSAFHLALSPRDLEHAAHQAAASLGYATLCDDTTDGWPVERAAGHLLAQLSAHRAANPGRKVCVYAGGEVASPVTGDGMGGRNSAFVLACVEKIAGGDLAVLSAGTDGIDGNSPAAGAVADGESLARAQEAGLSANDFAARSDAFTFFDRLGDTIVTGPTQNNLRDLRVLLAE